ncbi:hypothetical protein SI65_00692 [Aspergillus cristatus]|uniref:protein-tyrosine-phosphatase n=1 Tax=Aspergillus cristatus TaxID=573508 RepID=A0A1E3BQ48_ASPCR|nr:hypothetical protein SI65_00692 [Aspergillus cristatus]
MPNREAYINPSLDEIEPGLYLGNARSSTSLATLREYQILAMVSLGTEERHLFIPSLDSSTRNLLQHVTEACDFIERVRLSSVERPALLASVYTNLEEQPLEVETIAAAEVHRSNNVILVHCDWGVLRSSTIVIAYLMRKHRMSLSDALAMVKGKRRVRPNLNFIMQLEVWQDTGYEIYEDVETKTPKLQYKEFLEKRAKRLKEQGLTGDEPIAPVFP